MLTTDSSNIFADRQHRLTLKLQQAGFDGLVLNPGPSLVYFTGLHFHLSERPVLAIFTPNRPIILVTPELEAAKTSELPYPTQVYLYSEEPKTWQGVFQQAVAAANLISAVGVEPTRLRFLELQLLENEARTINFTSAETILSEMRMQKDERELSAMRHAVDIAQHALENTLPLIHIGMTERDLANELSLQLLRAGADPEIPFSPIISAGPNSANPHATPTERILNQGDLLVIDWGAYYHGYCSDLTRTFAVGDVEQELSMIAKIVLEANIAGRSAGKPGISAGEVDLAARSVIEKAGYGRFFTHRTGHGLGLEGHEAPYIRSGNQTILLPGMSYTVEPGIYLPNRGGVRIEDDMVVTGNSSESLSDLPRILRQVG